MRHQGSTLFISLFALTFQYTSASTAPSQPETTPTPTPWHHTSIAPPQQTIYPHLAQFILEQHASLSSATYTPSDESPNETFAPRALQHKYQFQDQNALRDPRPNIHAMPAPPRNLSPNQNPDPVSDRESESESGRDSGSEGQEVDIDIDNVKRQQGGIGGGAEYTATPTQMPTVWTYYLGGPAPITYTQLFVPTPDPWAGPQSGSIGLGTIQGTVGAVRGH